MTDTTRTETADAGSAKPQGHRTINRVTQILEEVVYNPGMTFSELVRALGAARSSVHGFIQGLLNKGWLYEDSGRFYLGPAVYGLTLASGNIRAGSVTYDDLKTLSEDTGIAAFLGVRAGDFMISVAEAGSDPVIGFDARTNIRRELLTTAAGKVLMSEWSESERNAYLRRCGPDRRDLVLRYLEEIPEIQRTRIAMNARHGGTRFAIATTVRDPSGDPVAALTLVGNAELVQPRSKELSALLVQRVQSWEARRTTPREAI